VLPFRNLLRSSRPEPAPAVVAASDADDLALVARLALDDGQALGELLQRYWAPMLAFAMEKVRAQDAAEDLVQEAFVRVWERRHQLRPHVSPRAYLYRVLRNLIIDEYRRHRLHDRFALFRSVQEPEAVPTPVALVEADDFAAAAKRAIAALPERRRDVFVLAHLHGCSYREVAETMGITTRTVANHMSMALAQLRDALAGYTGVTRREVGDAPPLPFQRPPHDSRAPGHGETEAAPRETTPREPTLRDAVPRGAPPGVDPPLGMSAS
jgi:RNA polymerase sigma-70 factor (ECF subfamily)